jgi:hypothetical protein
MVGRRILSQHNRVEPGLVPPCCEISRLELLKDENITHELISKSPPHLFRLVLTLTTLQNPSTLSHWDRGLSLYVCTQTAP